MPRTRWSRASSSTLGSAGLGWGGLDWGGLGRSGLGGRGSLGDGGLNDGGLNDGGLIGWLRLLRLGPPWRPGRLGGGLGFLRREGLLHELLVTVLLVGLGVGGPQGALGTGQ